MIHQKQLWSFKWYAHSFCLCFCTGMTLFPLLKCVKMSVNVNKTLVAPKCLFKYGVNCSKVLKYRLLKNECLAQICVYLKWFFFLGEKRVIELGRVSRQLDIIFTQLQRISIFKLISNKAGQQSYKRLKKSKQNKLKLNLLHKTSIHHNLSTAQSETESFLGLMKTSKNRETKAGLIKLTC